MTRVRCSAAARLAARFTVVVVLPTPPFWLAIARMCGCVGWATGQRLHDPPTSVESPDHRALRCTFLAPVKVESTLSDMSLSVVKGSQARRPTSLKEACRRALGDAPADTA